MLYRECGWLYLVATTSSSRRNRRSREVENVRQMSASEERSVQQSQQEEAEPLNMSVWTRRILVRRLDRYLAEYVSFPYGTGCSRRWQNFTPGAAIYRTGRNMILVYLFHYVKT